MNTNNKLFALISTVTMAWTGAAHALPSVDLITAMERGDTERATDLIRQGVDLRARTESGATALHAAAAYGYPEIAQMLLDAGADSGERGPNGNTPLLFAAQEGHVEVVRALLQSGADPAVANDVGSTAAGLAMGLGHREVAHELGATDVTDTPSPPSWLWTAGLLAAIGTGTTLLRRHRTGRRTADVRRHERYKQAV